MRCSLFLCGDMGRHLGSKVEVLQENFLWTKKNYRFWVSDKAEYESGVQRSKHMCGTNCFRRNGITHTSETFLCLTCKKTMITIEICHRSNFPAACTYTVLNGSCIIKQSKIRFIVCSTIQTKQEGFSVEGQLPACQIMYGLQWKSLNKSWGGMGPGSPSKQVWSGLGGLSWGGGSSCGYGAVARQTDKHDWKHDFLATTYAGGNKDFNV